MSSRNESRSLGVKSAAYLLRKQPEDLNTDQQDIIRRLLELCPEAGTAHILAQEFGSIVRDRKADMLDMWIQTALDSSISEMVGFGNSLKGDHDAVLASLIHPWSRGQVEGQVNRLKAIKRQMYGRASFDLLRAKVLSRV